MNPLRAVANRVWITIVCLLVVPALTLAQEPEARRPWTANLALVVVFVVVVAFLGYVMSRRRSRGVTRANPKSRV